MSTTTDTRCVEVDEKTARDTIAWLHFAATSGVDPTTWSDELRADARAVAEVYEEALAELTVERHLEVVPS